MGSAKNISYETLYNLYVELEKTQSEIGEILGASRKTIQKYMKLYNIESRDVNKDNSLLTKLGLNDEQFKSTLRYKYEYKKISINKISREFDVNQSVIRKYLKRYDIPLRDHKESNQISNSGSGNHKWKGGKKTHSDGYIMLSIPDYPSADPNGYVYEHRYVMEQHLGRFLKTDEHIHHVNEIKSDNNLSNLKVLTRSEHARIHGKNT